MIKGDYILTPWMVGTKNEADESKTEGLICYYHASIPTGVCSTPMFVANGEDIETRQAAELERGMKEMIAFIEAQEAKPPVVEAVVEPTENAEAV